MITSQVSTVQELELCKAEKAKERKNGVSQKVFSERQDVAISFSS
jgi:hypothetical protein